MVIILEFRIQNRLYFDGEMVGYRGTLTTPNLQEIFDVGKDDLTLIADDFIVSLSLDNNAKSSTLIQRGSSLVLSDDSRTVPELSYSSLAGILGKGSLVGTDTQLKMLYNKYNAEVFNNRLPKWLKVYWTNKMTKCAGICRHRRKRNPDGSTRLESEIGLSIPYHQKFPDDVSNTLVHEMIHVLYPRDKHGPLFRNEMDRVNRQHNMGITIYSKERATEKKYKYIYACSSCDQEYRRIKQVDLSRSSCGVCRGELYLKLDNTYQM